MAKMGGCNVGYARPGSLSSRNGLEKGGVNKLMAQSGKTGIGKAMSGTAKKMPMIDRRIPKINDKK